MTVLIVGGGIGGLTLALMLHRKGIRSVVYEQAPQIREVGVGINVLPHAIKELAALDLLPALDAVALRTKELIYINRLGQKIWAEPRGLDGGFDYPQFSIHRGRLQKLVHDAVIERLGPDAVRTGLRLGGFFQDEGGVTAHFVDSRFGKSSETVRGEVLVGADGIHSVVRRYFYPEQGRPSWQGVLLWRGATEWPKFLTGRSMYIGGGMGAKLALYPIAPGSTPETRLTNWAIGIRVADPAATTPPVDSWSRTGRMDEVVPYAARFKVPGVDVEALVRATPTCWEYPMCDRDPLPRWSFGRVTLLGDAAHPMYPVGSNGAAQAILDARCLSDMLARSEHPMLALSLYEEDRLPKTAEIVRLNRTGGPERVIDEVERRAPSGFDYIEQVMSPAERDMIVKGYAGKAGFALTQVNR
ncbi:flavin-dependent oxidoreductase [Prosthecomicrobium hirschii]|uniref:flavin-dependent oxidoreductase n=1 Tax=Prosthecodimorpha hirschii TaxID=665126 RepID=UPI00112ED366|nr:flavin-dependent oxidoreductase [Prosthecomicrobium hirschii]TPQ48217.1 flavin-dependent oxidoreductase [Prosthecomicrobium hirschii]